MTTKDRIIEFCKAKDLSIRQFEIQCNMSNGYVSSMRKGLGAVKLENVLKAFPELNRDWLLYGEGRMINGPYERINSILKIEGITQREFAKGVSFLFPSVYENAQKNPGDMDILQQWIDALLKRYPNYSREWILTGQGEMHKDTASVRSFPLITDRQVELQDIPLYDLSATAGLVAIYNDLVPDPIDHLRVPNLPPVDGAVYVRGDSMSPLLKSGDIIIFKKVETSPDVILWGQIYLLSYTVGGDTFTVVKYIKRSAIEGCIQLVSANSFYDPKDIPAGSITALALVKASITFYTME